MSYKVVQVIWKDAECVAAWTKLEDVKKAKLPVITTIGYLVYQDSERLVVASTISDDEVNASMSIPAAWVVEIFDIEFY